MTPGLPPMIGQSVETQTEKVDEKTTAHTSCTVYLDRLESLCTEPARYKVTAGCVHEHVVEQALCKRHVHQLSYSGLECGRCYFSSHSHECTIRATKVDPL
jgi:hypothetical protein